MKRRVAQLPCAFALVLVALCAGCEKQPDHGTAPTPDAARGPDQLTIEYEVRPSILIEAEVGEVHKPVAVFEDASASGGKYVLAPEGPEHKEISIGGDVAYRFRVKEFGEYRLWLRAKWSGACGNSVSVTLDGGDFGTVEDPVYDVWHWVPSNRRMRLSAGEHMLIIGNREDGAAIDQILYTQDSDYRPTGIEPPDVTARTVMHRALPPSILIEAEAGKLYDPVRAFDDPAASGGRYAAAPSRKDAAETSGGGVIYKLPVKDAGDYRLWLRVRWTGERGNNIDVYLNQQNCGKVEDAVYETWHWVSLPKPLHLAIGEHRLTLANREDGAAVDQILLARDHEYRPAEIERPNIEHRTVVGGVVAAPVEKR